MAILLQFQKAKAYQDQCFKQFPNGGWATTQATLLPGLQLTRTIGAKSKMEIYN